MFCSICLLGSITPNVYLYITVFYRNFLRMAFFIYTIYFRCSRLSPQTCCVSCSSHTPFCSCFVQLALRAQTDTKHERQSAPHDGSLATVCGNSRGSSIVQAGNYKIKDATHSFEWHLLFKFSHLLCKLSWEISPEPLSKAYIPASSHQWWRVSFCAMEMKLPGAWSPLANTIPALGEVHRNAQHKET